MAGKANSRGRKVFVVGPITPFTGGISHSNTTLCRNLAKRNEVTAISFSMMYPKMLYPGKKQKDGPPLKGAKFRQEFSINTMNPVSWIRVIRKARKERPDWMIFQWWHTYFFPGYYFIASLSKLLAKCRIGVVCQNVLPHEEGIAQKIIHRPLTKIFFRKADHIAALSSSDLKLLKGLMPRARADFIVEGTYQTFSGNRDATRAEARKKLKLPNKKIVLFFGAVRPYKDLGMLLDAMKIVSGKIEGALLVIAGAFWEPREAYEEQIAALGIKESVLIKDGYIPDEDVPLLFRAADVVVLSHKSSTESGIPQVAYVYNTPLIATAVGGNVDLIDNNKSGFLVPPQNASAMAKAITDFFKRGLYKDFKREMKKKEKMFEWSEEKEKKFFGEA